jgi:hypothetical protein
MVAWVGVGVVMPFPGVVVVAGGATVDDDEVVATAGVVEVELVDEVVDDVVEVVEGTGAGSLRASMQYDFPTSTVQGVARDGFC